MRIFAQTKTMSEKQFPEKPFDDKAEEASQQNPIRQYGLYSSIVFQMLAIIALGFWGGKKLNDYWKVENNLLTVALGFLGLALALYNTLKQLEKLNNR